MPEDDHYIQQMDLICRFCKAEVLLKIKDLFQLQETTRRSRVEDETRLSLEEAEVARDIKDDQEEGPEKV